jgi:hypothetical protein
MGEQTNSFMGHPTHILSGVDGHGQGGVAPSVIEAHLPVNVDG